VLTYVAAEASTRLVAHLAARLHNAAFFVYEQCQPHDGFGRFMIDHFTKVILPVLWNRNYFLRFRFRFRLLKNYGFGSGSGSDF
jgi:hypothetical protein